jgi:TfoX/Sxy family transcriptional regulator of competence genes
MKVPTPGASATKAFEALRPPDPRVTVRAVFGQPAAFVNGNMFFGVFGEAVFVRLSPEDREKASAAVGATAFEPMPGRPMREYVVLPPRVLGDAKDAKRWVSKSLAFAAGLPPKLPKAKSR